MSCGSFCSNTWYLNKNEKKCRGSKGGDVEILILDKKYAQGCVANKVYTDVDKHGYVSVYQRKGYFLIKSWTENNTVKHQIKVDLYKD